MKITLVRHGQTDANFSNILQGRANNLLNDTTKAFGEDKQFWPEPVKNTLDNDRQVIEMFNKYIDQL